MLRCCSGFVEAVNTVVDTSAFVSILGPSDTDVQRALETIDGVETGVPIEAAYPRGVVDRDDSILTWDNATKTLTMAIEAPATSFEIFEVGGGTVQKHTFVTDQSSTIAVPAPGLWWFWYNGGVLSNGASPPYGFKTTLVALVYLDASLDAIAVLDERHGINMPWATHEYLHYGIGTRFETGLAMARVASGGGGADGDAQITISGGTIWDEDIDVSIVRSAAPASMFEQELGSGVTPGQFPIYYRLGAAGEWAKIAATTFPVHNVVAGDRPAFNNYSGGLWGLTEISANGNYAVMWICATNNVGQADPAGAGYLVEPVFAIMGQADYASATDAQDASFSDLNLGTFFANELKPIWKLIYRCRDGYANSVNAYIYEYADLRNTAPIPGTGFVATDHNSLAGRSEPDSHPATAISADTSAFAGNLSSLDDTLQKCMDTLDNLLIGETATLYVSTAGSDATGTRGLLTKPYATVVGALTDASSGDVVKLGPGTFTEAGLVIPDTLTDISIVGSGRGVTTLTFSGGYLGRVSATAITRFRLAELTYSRGAGTGINFDGSASANGYFNSTTDGLTIENVDDASSGVAAVGWAIERAGYVRFQNVSMLGSGGSLTFTDCGEVRLRNVLKRGVLGAWDLIEAVATGTLPTGFTRMLFAFYSAKITETTINASSPALDFTTDASCEITGSVMNFRPDAVAAEELNVYLSGRMDDSQINIGEDTATSTTPIHAELAGITMSPSLSITGSDNVDINANIKNSDVDSITATESYADGTISINADGTRTDSVVLNATLGTIDSEFINSQVPEMPTVSGNTNLIIRGTTTGTKVNKGWTPAPMAWSYNAVSGNIDTETDPRLYFDKGVPIRFFMPGGEFIYSDGHPEITSVDLTGLQDVIVESSGRMYLKEVVLGAGNYRVDVYTNVDPSGVLENLVGQTSIYTMAGTYAVTPVGSSPIGGTVTVGALVLVDTSSVWEFFRWGVVTELSSTEIEWVGCDIDATASFLWYADVAKKVTIVAFVGGNIGTDASIISNTNFQRIVIGAGPSRAIQGVFVPYTVNGGGVNANWITLTRASGFEVTGDMITAIPVTIAGLNVGDKGSITAGGANRIGINDSVDIKTESIAGGSVGNLSASLLCVME